MWNLVQRAWDEKEQAVAWNSKVWHEAHRAATHASEAAEETQPDTHPAGRPAEAADTPGGEESSPMGRAENGVMERSVDRGVNRGQSAAVEGHMSSECRQQADSRCFSPD